MKSVFVLGALLVAATQAYVEDMTPYRSVIGGSPTPSMIAASSAAVPSGYHVQMSYVRDATRKTVPYTYGAPIRAESIPQGLAMRAPTMMQPEMAFVPTLASAAPASADDLPVHAATAFPAPPAAPFASFLEAQASALAEAELDAELEADLDLEAETEVESEAESETHSESEAGAELNLAAGASVTVGGMVEAEAKTETSVSLAEGIAEAAAFAEELQAVLENGDAAELERERQEEAFRAATGGAAPEAEQEMVVPDASFIESEAAVEVDAEALAEAEAEAELDAELEAEVDEDLDLEEEGSADADVEAEVDADADAEGEQDFEAEFDA